MKLIFFIYFIPIIISKCGDGILIFSELENCDDGNILSNDGCSSQCQIESNYSCITEERKKSECFLKKPFSADAFFIPLSDPYDINVTFSKPLKNHSLSFFEMRMNISIEGLNESNFTFGLKKNLGDERRGFIIQFNFKVAFTKTKITIGFKNFTEIFDVFNQHLGYGSEFLVVEIPSYIVYSNNEKEFMNFMTYFIWIVFGVMIFCFIPLSIMNSLTIFWSFLDSMQLIHLLLLINADYPQQTLEVLRNLRVANFQISDYSNYAQFSRDLIFLSLEYNEDSTVLPQKIVQEGFSTRFIINSIIAISILICSIAFFVLVEILYCISRKSTGRIAVWISKIRKKTNFSLIFRALLITYTPLSVSTILQFCNLNFNLAGNIIQSIYGCITAFILLTFPLTIFYLLNFKSLNLEEDEVQSKYNAIYDSLITNAILKKNFVLFYLLRKFLWPLFIILFFDDPLFQLFGLICLSVSIITLLILKKPYKSKAICNEFIFNEILVLALLMILSGYLILGYLGEEYLDLTNVVKFGWILVGILSSIIFIKLSFMIFSIVMNVGLLVSKTKKIINIIKNEPVKEDVLDKKDISADQPTFIELPNVSSSRDFLTNRKGEKFMYPENPQLRPKMIEENVEFEDSEDEEY